MNRKLSKNNKIDFERRLDEAVKKGVRKVLKEYGFDDYPADEPISDDDFQSDWLDKTIKGNEELGFDGYSMKASSKPQDADFDNDEEEEDELSDIDLTFSSKADSEDSDPLYADAMDAIESSDGNVTFEEWFSGHEEEDKGEAKTAFDKAMGEYNAEDVPEIEDAAEFGDRKESTKTDVSNSAVPTSYDGVEITKDGDQYSMLAKMSNPQITIKGSNVEEVKRMYDNLWNDFASMEDKARKIGQTNFHGALMWADQYDDLVRSSGMHQENLPVVIDLDKIADKKRGGSRNVVSDNGERNDLAWLEPYKHWNGQYLMTDYQASQLTPQQKAQWDELKKTNPKVYAQFDQYPSEKKANRYKKD